MAKQLSAWRLWRLGEEKELIFENLSLLLRAGVTIEAALEDLEEEIENIRLKAILKMVLAEVRTGTPLWKALEAQGFVPDRMIALIKIGEEAGILTDQLDLIVSQERKEHLFRTRIRSALLYPSIVLGMTAVVGIVSMWISLPKLVVVFSEVQVELPLMTRLLIAFSNFLQHYGAIAIPGFFVLVGIVAYVLFLRPSTKNSGEGFLFAVPGLGRLLRGVEIARFGYTFGSLLTAGIPIIQALESLASAASFKRYQALYRYLHERVEAGDSLEKSFAAYPHIDRLLPISIRQMIATAEKASRLPDVLKLIGRTYEEKTESQAKDLAVIIEPIILILVGAIVACVAIGIIMPIYNLSSQIT